MTRAPSKFASALRAHTVAGLGLMVGLSAACTNPVGQSTELIPEGPPKIRQVIMQERIQVAGGAERLRDQLAFGVHPDIEDEDAIPGVQAALVRGSQRIRVIFDELLLGTRLEEVACGGGVDANFYARVPDGATPEDVDRCSPPELSRCTGPNAICIDPNTGEPVGILDGEQDGAIDDFRMIRYDDGNLGVRMECDGVNIPLDQQQSFWNPSGNQLVPVQVDGSLNLDGIGPGLDVVPEDGMRTSSNCSISFNPSVIDKDGNTICAPAGGDPLVDCSPGDTTLISWTTAPLRVLTLNPQDQAVAVPAGIAPPNGGAIRISFNASVDGASAAGITVSNGGGPVAATFALSADDPTLISAEFAAGFEPNETHTVTIPTTFADRFGGLLPEVFTFSFSTGDAPAPPPPPPSN